MKAAFLPDRGVIRIAGEDARHFLNNLVTSELGALTPGTARFAALLTPQGRIIADFLVTEAATGGLLIDCAKELAAPLAARLGIYKLRAKLTIENLSETLGVVALWNGAPATMPELAFVDPRNPALGLRALVTQDAIPNLLDTVRADLVGIKAYEAHRIACGVPDGGTDFAYGDAFPHETNMDRLSGVNFDKGCYIGQEVVSRMQHRGTARTRIVRVTLQGDAPPPGAPVTADDKQIGTLGSFSEGKALAMLRLDKAGDAIRSGAPMRVGNATLILADPNDARLPEKKVNL